MRTTFPSPGSTARPSGTYVPALDGLRALAVCAVLAFHGGVAGAGGGFLGVDAFFVLSGYLITGLLLAEWQTAGRIDVLAFWGRRARRLLPALLLMVSVVAVAGRDLLPPEELLTLRGDGVAALLYVANWRMILRGGDYFAATATPSPLEHTWSLGIEEQFYLLWPIILVLLLGLAGKHRWWRRLLLVTCAVGVVASTVTLAVVHTAADPGRAYYGSDTRASSLLVGAGLAVALSGAPRATAAAARRAVGLAALVGVLVTGWAWTHASGGDTRLYHGGLLVTALAVTAVLADVALVPDGWTARALSIPPLPALGRISYGVYLWHWPVFLAVDADRSGLHGWWLLAARCGLTLLVASASYHLLELPVRRRRRATTGALGLCAAAAAVAAGALVVTDMTVPPRATAAALASAGDGLDGLHRPDASNDAPATTGGSPWVGVPPAAARRPRRAAPTHHRPPGRPVVVDVFGDSVAWSLVTYLPRRPGFDVRDRTMLGCGIVTAAPYQYFGTTYPAVPAKCRAWRSLWSGAVAADDPDVALVLVGRWETMTRTWRGGWGHVGEPGFDAFLRASLDRAIAVAGARGARVVLVTEPYNRRGEQPDGTLYPEDRPSRVTAWNRLLRGVARTHPGVRVLDLGARISPEGRFTWDAGGVQVRADGLHLTPAGVQRWIAPWLWPRLARLAPR